MLVKLMTSESEKSHGSMMLRLVTGAGGKNRVLTNNKPGLELLLLVLAPWYTPDWSLSTSLRWLPNIFHNTLLGSYGLQLLAHPLWHQPGPPHDLHLHADVLPLHALQAQHQQEQDHGQVWTDALVGNKVSKWDLKPNFSQATNCCIWIRTLVRWTGEERTLMFEKQCFSSFRHHSGNLWGRLPSPKSLKAWWADDYIMVECMTGKSYLQLNHWWWRYIYMVDQMTITWTKPIIEQKGRWGDKDTLSWTRGKCDEGGARLP